MFINFRNTCTLFNLFINDQEGSTSKVKFWWLTKKIRMMKRGGDIDMIEYIRLCGPKKSKNSLCKEEENHIARATCTHME